MHIIKKKAKAEEDQRIREVSQIEGAELENVYQQLEDIVPTYVPDILRQAEEVSWDFELMRSLDRTELLKTLNFTL